LDKLRDGNFIYPCTCSRKDIQQAVTAPHAADDERIYPGTCRERYQLPVEGCKLVLRENKPEIMDLQKGTKFSWRFRVPDGEAVSFHDENLGEQQFVAGKDFGDFVVWRHDGVPAYQLACMVDDAAMGVSEVVRGADLLVSTARQILLYRALSLKPPAFFHCELMRDERGERLAKRHDSLALRTLRGRGIAPAELRAGWAVGD
jgi:glutamyl-tRNA synthetase